VSASSSAPPKRIVVGVTSAESIVLMTGLPDRLKDEGWDVHVVSSPGSRLEALKRTGVAVHALNMSRDPAPIRDLRALWEWLLLLRELRPDVVLIGTPKAGLLGMIASAAVKVPVRLYHLRGLRLETVQGWRRRLYTALERLSMRLATKTVAVSPSLRSLVIDLGLGPESGVVVLGEGSSNGVDVRRFHPGAPEPSLADALHLEHGVPVVGFVGRITRDKGGRELAAASRELSARGVRHQLLIVGPVEGDQAMRELDALADTIRIISTGQVADTAPLFRLMTVFCLPTLREGFPNVVLEAAASGVCVVTTDATGAVDSIIDGVTGFMCRAGDAKTLADALERGLTDSVARERVASAGRARVEAAFTRDIVQNQLVSFVAASINGHESARGLPGRRRRER
jgi:glycosyltransferase involved in cell wall biosynthesis